MTLYNLKNAKEVLDLSNDLMNNVKSLQLYTKILGTSFKELVQMAENIMKNHVEVGL